MTGYDETRRPSPSGGSSRRTRSPTRPRVERAQSSTDRRERKSKQKITRHGKTRSMNHNHHDLPEGSRGDRHSSKSSKSSSSGSGRSSSQKRRDPALSFHSNDFILKRHTAIHPYYTLGTLLGEGGFGACYVAHHKETGAERACKILPKSSTDQAANDEAHAEFQMMAQLDHPNIAKVYELYEDDESFYIVTDLYKGGDLFDIVEQGQLGEYDTAQVITSLLQAVSYLHQRNLCHRDLKPENILLDGSYGGCKLIDFGMSRLEDPHHPFTECLGSLEYVAPQVLQQKYTKSSDIWSVGVIAFVLLAGRPPFNGNTDAEIAAAIQKGTFAFSESFWKTTISDDCQDFIQALLAYDEKDRLTAEQALDHPWIERMRIKYLKDHDREMQGLIKKSLDVLEHFKSSHSPLKQATCALLSAQFFTKKDRDQIDPIYRVLDRSFAGKLSTEDLHFAYWYTDFAGEDRTDAQMERIVRESNVSQSGFITYSEFAAVMMLETGLVNTERLQDVFHYYDSAGKGDLDWRDLEKVLFPKKKGRTSEDRCRKIIFEATHGDSKTISFADFKRIMLPKKRKDENITQ